LTQLTSLRVNACLPTSAFSSVLGLPLLEDLGMGVIEHSVELAHLTPQSLRLTRLQITGAPGEKMVGPPIPLESNPTDAVLKLLSPVFNTPCTYLEDVLVHDVGYTFINDLKI